MQQESAAPQAVRPQTDWQLLDRKEAAAVLGVSRSTFNRMIQLKIVPDGIEIFARAKKWRVDVMKETAERLYNGEFTGVRLWGDSKTGREMAS